LFTLVKIASYNSTMCEVEEALISRIEKKIVFYFSRAIYFRK
jgi:hypothetical protein